MAQARRMKLDEALSYHQFEDDAEEEDSWAMEKLRTLEAIPVPKDLRQVVGSQQKAKVFVGFSMSLYIEKGCRSRGNPFAQVCLGPLTLSNLAKILSPLVTAQTCSICVRTMHNFSSGGLVSNFFTLFLVFHFWGEP